jgi:hypothetical protein
MTIKQLGGVFGRNPTFNNATIDGELIIGDSSASTVGTSAYLVGDNFYLNNQESGILSFGTDATARLEISSTGEIFAYKQYIGGFGALATSGTDSFDHSSNARAGNAYTLLQGSDTGGPGGTAYYHVFNYEYNTKDGTGNMTQLAYGYNDLKAYMRYKYVGTWSSWVALH